MSDKIVIYGKSTWPYTNGAREAFEKQGKQFEYIDVIANPEKMDDMLKHSDGQRRVPVIVDKNGVTIGFNGKTWGV